MSASWLSALVVDPLAPTDDASSDSEGTLLFELGTNAGVLVPLEFGRTKALGYAPKVALQLAIEEVRDKLGASGYPEAKLVRASKRSRGRPTKAGLGGSSLVRAVLILHEFERTRQDGKGYIESLRITCKNVTRLLSQGTSDACVVASRAARLAEGLVPRPEVPPLGKPMAIRCSPTEVKTVLSKLQPSKGGKSWRVAKAAAPEFGAGPVGDYLRNLHQGGQHFELRAEAPQEPPKAKRARGFTFGRQGT